MRYENRRKHNQKAKWEFTTGNLCLITVVYTLIIIVILSARSSHNQKLEDFEQKTTQNVAKSENPEKLSCHSKYRRKNGVDHCAEMPNDNFVFHNKIPKSGSTTFLAVVAELAKKNDFDLVHMLPCFDEKDSAKIQDEEYFETQDWSLR